MRARADSQSRLRLGGRRKNVRAVSRGAFRHAVLKNWRPNSPSCTATGGIVRRVDASPARCGRVVVLRTTCRAAGSSAASSPLAPPGRRTLCVNGSSPRRSKHAQPKRFRNLINPITASRKDRSALGRAFSRRACVGFSKITRSVWLGPRGNGNFLPPWARRWLVCRADHHDGYDRAIDSRPWDCSLRERNSF